MIITNLKILLEYVKAFSIIIILLLIIALIYITI
jgi:hypothetical protein